MKKGSVLLSGNEAIARGAYESGVKVAAGYPGTPSTEILENLVKFEGVFAEWSPNEKVALEVAIGCSMAGERSLVTMKHVGLNVASDTLMTLSYTGVNGGLVIVSADDPGPYSSQNEQDNRFYAKFAAIPLLEPSDSQEAKDLVLIGFELSEKYDTPVLLRTTTRIAHSKGLVELGNVRKHIATGFKKDTAKYVMLPGFAKERHSILLDRLKELQEYSEKTELNFIEEGSNKIGILSSGIAYQYAKEVAPHLSYMKLGLTYPLPIKKIKEFSKKVKRIIVVEELEPFLQEQLNASGIKAKGKEFFPCTGELNSDLVEQGLAKAGVIKITKSKKSFNYEKLSRPPVLCAGCPHTSVFMALKELRAIVTGDIGCYTLGALKPLNAMDSCICMGASIGNAIGLEKSGIVDRKKIVAVIGDSTFLHSGITPLLDAVYNKSSITVIILNNYTTAMTGFQPHPGTGKTLAGEDTTRVDFEKLCRALGVEDVRTIDPYDYKSTLATLKEALNSEKLSVLITNRPCVLYPEKVSGIPYKVILEDCIACQICLNLGCPSIKLSEEFYKTLKKVEIDRTTCIGCSICAQVCPTSAIIPEE